MQHTPKHRTHPEKIISPSLAPHTSYIHQPAHVYQVAAQTTSYFCSLASVLIDVCCVQFSADGEGRRPAECNPWAPTTPNTLGYDPCTAGWVSLGFFRCLSIVRYNHRFVHPTQTRPPTPREWPQRPTTAFSICPRTHLTDCGTLWFILALFSFSFLIIFVRVWT